MKFKSTLAVVLLAPSFAWAAGTAEPTPPKPTATTNTCAQDGLVWDATSESCVAPKDSRLDDDTRYDAARELAHGGHLDSALIVLAAMSDQNADRVLTYKGFVARKQGHWGKAMRFYTQALDQNPDNLLARSYYGQGLALAGAKPAAERQLAEIRQRGGAGSWAEAALVQTLAGDHRADY
ncbi:MAG: tetratricopeptide repeat protein [Thalassovita sp.]